MPCGKFKILSSAEVRNLTHPELIKYFRELLQHGEYISNYVEELKALHWEISEEFKCRVLDLEWEIACIQADREDDMGSSEPPDTYIN